MAGYNIYYGCIWGTRTAFRIGLQVTFIAVAIGLVIGCLTGYLGGLIDGVLMMVTDIFSGLPSLLLAMVLIASTELPSWLGSIPGFWGALSKLDKIVLALAFTTWTAYARLVRGQVMKVKNEDYVEAAEAVGCSDSRIIFRHVLPNSISPPLGYGFIELRGSNFDGCYPELSWNWNTRRLR
ncbi:MAG: ABC transporter permease [Thermoproteota archaeon]